MVKGDEKIVIVKGEEKIGMFLYTKGKGKKLGVMGGHVDIKLDHGFHDGTLRHMKHASIDRWIPET